MVIVNQKRNVIVYRCCVVFAGLDDDTIRAILSDDVPHYFPRDIVIGAYQSCERRQEVMQQIVNAYKEGLPVFEMPKE